MKHNRGVVSILALWIILFLSLIAWGLGRRSSLEVSLMETYRGKMRSYAAARGGVNVLLDLLQRSPVNKDTLYSTGIAIDQTKSPEDIYARIDTGHKTHANVAWLARNFNTGSGSPALQYGLRDESGRININAIAVNNYQILSALFQLKGSSQSDGDKLALAVVSYTGNNAAAGNNNFLGGTTLKPKNKRYENILELLEVDGMTRDIFDKIKDDVTVYGDIQNGLWINTDTANNDVITAVASAAARFNPAVNAGSIVAEACSVRDGADGLSFTADDGNGSIAGLKDPNWPFELQEGTSNYYRARVVGFDEESGIRTVLEVVIHEMHGSAGQIVSWQRD